MANTFRLGAYEQQSVDAYVEYDRIVGNADGGKMFTEAEYAEFKAKVAEARSKGEVVLALQPRAGGGGGLDAHARGGALLRDRLADGHKLGRLGGAGAACCSPAMHRRRQCRRSAGGRQARAWQYMPG